MQQQLVGILGLGVFDGPRGVAARIEDLIMGRFGSPKTSRRRVAASLVALGALAAVASLSPQWIAYAQAPQAFEVVSIRKHVGGVGAMGRFRSSGPRAEYEGFPIQMLVMEAWDLRKDQVQLSPTLTGLTPREYFPTMDVGASSGIYEIVAKAPEGTAPTRSEFRVMLRRLLADRFKLASHVEKLDTDVYVLARNGTPRLKPNTGDGECHVNSSRPPGGQKIDATHCPIQTLINDLFVDRPIIDRTELDGFYDFEITAALPFQSKDPDAITPFTAVKDLGLNLEARKIPIDTTVIDHVEFPEEN